MHGAESFACLCVAGAVLLPSAARLCDNVTCPVLGEQILPGLLPWKNQNHAEHQVVASDCPEGSVDVTCLDSSAVGTCVIQDGALNFWAESEFGGADMKAKLGGYRRHLYSNYCLSF